MSRCLSLLQDQIYIIPNMPLPTGISPSQVSLLFSLKQPQIHHNFSLNWISPPSFPVDFQPNRCSPIVTGRIITFLGKPQIMALFLFLLLWDRQSTVDWLSLDWKVRSVLDSTLPRGNCRRKGSSPRRVVRSLISAGRMPFRRVLFV